MSATNPDFDPEEEAEYWRSNYRERPYVDRAGFEDFGPAYAYGIGMYFGHGPRGFETAEPDLERGWDDARGTSSLTWERARHAVKDAWDRLTHAGPSDETYRPTVHDTGVRS